MEKTSYDIYKFTKEELVEKLLGADVIADSVVICYNGAYIEIKAQKVN